VKLKDTIAAISTPPGVGGIGIIRVSGPESEEIGSLLFKHRKKAEHFRTHHLYHGDIVSPENGAVLDEVLITIMRKPHSYTGEDILEINCHGGPVILQSILNEVIKAGARLAEPGEFTRRAFLNDRLDLSQAEAISDMIMARTNRGLDLAITQLKGNLSEKIKSARSSTINILALLETSIDFPEEDIELLPASKLTERIQSIIDSLEDILSTYHEGKVYRDGISAVIIGKPNVGKSSLLNRLFGERRVIVTSTPGTTRDFIEEVINVRGIPLKITDTAGIRDAENIIEKKGVELVWEKLSSADIIIIVLDGSEKLTKEDLEIIEKNRHRNCVLVINKSDLPHMINIEKLDGFLPGKKPLWLSAKYGEGIPALKEHIHSLIISDEDDRRSDIIITNLRHKTALEKAVTFLSKAGENVREGMSPEFAALDLRESLESMGEIIGQTVNEEVLDRIFSTFCIGK
jgi:tRNA modification GTPase